ncbi:MAG TPA: S41 family peptidase [Candidatus Sulfotelmatobacter sp.]|nr:S41 family peptidase [Candidatus Sulfotelmatobacter sp.]
MPTRSFRWSLFAAFAASLFLSLPALALDECRLLRQPDVQGDNIVFVYGGDLWTVARSGGVASRLTSSEGVEQFPKFSPDGKTIAFTGEYDGNVDAYTIPTTGGEPTRLTWHPGADQVAEWYPDGKSILIRSARASSIQRYTRFFKVPASGGFEEMLKLPTAGYCSLSPDAQQIAFVSPSYDNRTWKRYRGGNAPNIWVYDFAKNMSENITADWDGPDEWPMWYQNTIYYCSDRGGRTANLWAYDLGTKQQRQVTHFEDYDVKWPSIGSDAIVFENGGYLWVMDLPSEKASRIQVLVPDDKPATRAELRNVSKWINGADLSPSGKRAVFEARGDLFTVPAENGDPRDLTNTPGARERDPAWSPDGKWVACLSDASGEYEIWVYPSDGKGAGRQVTRGGNTFRYAPVWSPDSKKIAFSDKTKRLWYCDVASGAITEVDMSPVNEINDYQWSSDSRWLTYSRTEMNNFNRVMLYSLDSKKATAVSDGMTDDFDPSLDPGGRYLYFVSRRTVHPQFGQFEFDFQFRATDKIYAVTLRDTLQSPVRPKSDEEEGSAAEESKDKGGDKDKGGKKEAKGTGKSETVLKVDLDGLGQRCAVLPIEPSRYANLIALDGKLLYVELEEPDPDASGPGKGTLHYFDLDKREDKTVLSGIDRGYSTTRDGGKVLYHADDTWGVVDVGENKKVGDGKLNTGSLMAVVDPRQEWMQMFNEAWRLERDFYYDPAMGGLDWKAIGERYRQLVPYAAHRSDLNYILGELIGELSTSHTYVGGGDFPDVPKTGVGLLGADYEVDAASGAYRFKTIYRDRDWNTKIPAPLGEPGIGVKEGDYLLSVNGQPIRAPRNLYAAFAGTVDQDTRIAVGKTPNDPRPRTYVVRPIANEASLRYTAWVEGNREKVEKASHGRLAYIHVPNTATAGIQEFTKQYYPQVDRDGIIVDERFNGGGFIPDFFVERLWRTTWSYWSNRDGTGFRTPSTAIDGPKCILINEYAGSGGDAFPYYFRLQKLGPVIGKRTWGGLVGISHDLPLMDGGSVTMPDFGIYNTQGEWTVENHGIDPDIEVENAPHLMVQGRDPQLERAIQYCLDELTKNPVKRPERPKYKVQPGLGK